MAEEPRLLGLAMVPGHHIVKLFIDQAFIPSRFIQLQFVTLNNKQFTDDKVHTTHGFYSLKLRQKTLNIYEKCSLREQLA